MMNWHRCRQSRVAAYILASLFAPRRGYGFLSGSACCPRSDRRLWCQAYFQTMHPYRSEACSFIPSDEFSSKVTPPKERQRFRYLPDIAAFRRPTPEARWPNIRCSVPGRRSSSIVYQTLFLASPARQHTVHRSQTNSLLMPRAFQGSSRRSSRHQSRRSSVGSEKEATSSQFATFNKAAMPRVNGYPRLNMPTVFRQQHRRTHLHRKRARTNILPVVHADGLSMASVWVTKSSLINVN